MDGLARLQSRIILERCGTDCQVAALSIGMFGYHSRLPVIDVLGIVDPVISRSRVGSDYPALPRFPGHYRTNADYVLARRPRFVLVEARNDRMLPVSARLLDHPAFSRDYVYDRELFGFALREQQAAGGE
jgi:hypothetical protein